MKILMIAGLSNAVLWFRQELIKFLIDKGNQVTVVACDDDEKERIEQLGVEFYSIGGSNRDTGIMSNIKYIKELKALIKKINPDKIMTFHAKANTFGIIAAKKAGYNDITAMVEGLGSVYIGTSFKSKLVRKVSNILYKKAFKNIPHVIFLNEHDKNKFYELKNVKENQCMLIDGIGIDVDKFRQDKQPNDGVLRFIMIARIEVLEKGIIEYCEAAKKLIESGVKDVEFHYYGICNSDVNPVLKYKDYVQYGGYTNDIKSVLEGVNVMVLPSYYNEGLPRSILEAMALGKAIITTNRPGCDKTVVDGVNGYFVEEKSVDDLAEKMRKLAEDRDAVYAMGKESRRIVEERFDADKINEQIWEKIS